MKRLLIAMLFISLLIGLAITDVNAGEIVILQCAQDWTMEQPDLNVRSCSKSAGISVSCPTTYASTYCAQTLANFLSVGGMKIINVQPFQMDGVTYTLHKD